MKDRILQIMRSRNMSQNEFAAAIGISAASLSSIINGHNNPTTKYVFAIHDRFPEISVNWLMFGEGEMTSGVKKSQDDKETATAPITPSISAMPATVADKGQQTPLAQRSQMPVVERENIVPQAHRQDVKNFDKPQRRIKEIRIFFDDNTFEVFKGNIP